MVTCKEIWIKKNASWIIFNRVGTMYTVYIFSKVLKPLTPTPLLPGLLQCQESQENQEKSGKTK